MSLIAVKRRKRVVLAAMLVTMLGSAIAFGEDRDPCYEAYRQSGLTHQHMSFRHFREMYSGSICAPGDLAAKHERSALREEVVAM
jgi:hypothetical protein